MPWFIAIDWSLQSMQKLAPNRNQSYFDYSRSIARSVIDKLHNKDPYDVVSVVGFTLITLIKFSAIHII